MTLTRAAALVAPALVLALPLTACLPLDGKAERHLMTSEPAPKSLEISSRFLDVDVTLATNDEVGIVADVYLETSGGHATAEKEIEFLKVNVVRDGDKLIVRQGDPNNPWHFSGSHSGKGKIAITLPADLPLVVRSASGDVVLAGDFGDVAWSVSTASGDVCANKLGVDALTVRTASGDSKIDVLQPLSKFEAEAASGDLRFTGGADTANASAASGDIQLSGIRGATTVSSASGDVFIDFVASDELRNASTSVKVSTASGDVTIGLPSDVVPSGAVSTASGSIDTDAGLSATKTKRGATFGGKGATLTVSTASGDVHVNRK